MEFQSGDTFTIGYVPRIGIANGAGTAVSFGIDLPKKIKTGLSITSNTIAGVQLKAMDGSSATLGTFKGVDIASNRYSINVNFNFTGGISYKAYSLYISGSITFG